MKTRASIIDKIGKVFDKYKFEPKTTTTSQHIHDELTEWVETLKGTGWCVNVTLYVVDEYAICGFALVKSPNNKRFDSQPEFFWIEDDVEYDTESAYENAMSLIQARK